MLVRVLMKRKNGTSRTGAHGGREHQQNWCLRWWRTPAEQVPTVVESTSGTGAHGGREHQQNWCPRWWIKPAELVPTVVENTRRTGANGSRAQCLWSLLGHCFKQFGCLKMALGSLKRRHWLVEEGGRHSLVQAGPTDLRQSAPPGHSSGGIELWLSPFYRSETPKG